MHRGHTIRGRSQHGQDASIMALRPNLCYTTKRYEAQRALTMLRPASPEGAGGRTPPPPINVSGCNPAYKDRSSRRLQVTCGGGVFGRRKTACALSTAGVGSQKLAGSNVAVQNLSCSLSTTSIS